MAIPNCFFAMPRGRLHAALLHEFAEFLLTYLHKIDEG